MEQVGSEGKGVTSIYRLSNDFELYKKGWTD